MSNRRKRQIQNQQPQPKESRPFQFTAKETQPSTQLEATFEKEGEILSYTYQDWHLKFKGSDNLYPQTLAWAYRNAPTHRAIIESIVAMAKGNVACIVTAVRCIGGVHFVGVAAVERSIPTKAVALPLVVAQP